METEDICNISISPLVTMPFAAQWSSDNQISLITETGVYILALDPSPMSPNPSIKFARSFIYPSDILPAYEFVSEIDSLIWQLEHEDVYSLLMEEAITPKLDDIKSTFLRIVKIAWSSKDLISPNQCLLAILTKAGAVELLHKVSNEWYSICNVSSLRLSNVRNEIESIFIKYKKCKKSSNQYTMITESMRQLQACSITWSELFEIEEIPFSYFSVAYRSGDISIWKIPRISNFITSLQPVFINNINPDIAVKINEMCWVTINPNEHLLIVGYFDGRINGIKCSGNDLKTVSIEKYIDPDRIAINYFHIISQVKSNIRILVAKGFYLLLLHINETGVLKSMRHLQMESFNITGITPIASEQFLITTQDSQTFFIDTQQNDLIKKDVKSHLPQTRIQYLGLAQSPSKVMFLIVTSPNMVYDHLVTREPSAVHMFALKDAKWDPVSVINNSTNLINVWDCIELLRVKAAKMENPSKILCSMTKELESFSIYNAQVSMWMTVILNVCKMKKSIPNIDHIKQSKISQMLPLIFVHSICTYLNNLTKRRGALSEIQILSISLLKKHLEVYLANEDKNKEEEENIRSEIRILVRQHVQDTLNAIAFCPTQIEKCNLCGETINEFSWNITSCPLGHKLSRCTITLLQITSFEYRVCPICSQIFHPCFEEVYKEPRCPFCDVPILYNKHDFDVEESELYGRNLSQLRIDMQSSVEEDSEQQFEKQNKSEFNSSDIHLVTENNSDEFSEVVDGDIE